MASALELVMGKDSAGVALSASLMATVAVTVNTVRKNLRDFPRFNELVREELSDEEIADCILDMIAEFNGLPPFFSQFGPQDFPDRKLLQDKAVAECIERLFLWHARNQFSASDSGLQVPIHEQWQPLMQISTMMDQRNDKKCDRLKAMLNISNGFGGGVGSPIGLGGY
jgi:hypothetical protein